MSKEPISEEMNEEESTSIIVENPIVNSSEDSPDALFEKSMRDTLAILSKPVPSLDTDLIFDGKDNRQKIEHLSFHTTALANRSAQFEDSFTKTFVHQVKAVNQHMVRTSNDMGFLKETFVKVLDRWTDFERGVGNKVQCFEKQLKGMAKNSENFASDWVENNNSSKYFSDIGRVVWPIMHLLVDGLKGIAGWVPVDHVLGDGQVDKLVVLSVPMVQFLVKTYDNHQSNLGKIDHFLKTFLSRYRYGHGSRMTMSEFMSIMIKTPFKPYLLTNATHVTKGNIENYIIMEADYFKGVLAEAAKAYPNRPQQLPENFPDAKLNPNLMYQKWATEAQSRTDSRTPEISAIRQRLSFEERKQCIPMLTTWWKECYGSAMVDFFDMDTSAPRMGHVRSGKYVADPPPKQSVRSFDFILQHEETFADDKTVNVSTDEEADVDKFETSKGKGKPKRRRERELDPVEEPAPVPFNRKKSKKTKKNEVEKLLG